MTDVALLMVLLVNDFFLASQFWITGEMYKRRADLVGFINGLPLIFIELKAVHNKVSEVFWNPCPNPSGISTQKFLLYTAS